MHARIGDVCYGVDAEAHKILEWRQVYCICCHEAASDVDYWDHFADGTLFGRLFENDPEGMDFAHSGMTTREGARNDFTRSSCEPGLNTNTLNSINLQTDSGSDHSTCREKKNKNYPGN